MIAINRPLRFAALLCILATFPAVGQVENATDTNSANLAAPREQTVPDRPVLERSVQAVPQLRLVASAPELGGISAPDLAMSAAPARRTAPRSVPELREPAAIERAPTLSPTPASMPSPIPVLVDQRIAALSAVPNGPAPVREVGSMTAADFISTWADTVIEYLRMNWRQTGLTAALVIAAGLLFWRLGERSRHGDLGIGPDRRLQELAFPRKALPEIDLTAMTLEAHSEFVDCPTVRRGTEEPLHDVPVIGGVRQQPRFGTLREALVAMKADMAQAD